MPRYKCHKEVWALRIKEVVFEKVWVMYPADEGFGPIILSQEFVEKHNPQPGGYFVTYNGNYSSYSPAKAFEEGYTRIN